MWNAHLFLGESNSSELKYFTRESKHCIYSCGYGMVMIQSISRSLAALSQLVDYVRLVHSLVSEVFFTSCADGCCSLPADFKHHICRSTHWNGLLPRLSRTRERCAAAARLQRGTGHQDVAAGGLRTHLLRHMQLGVAIHQVPRSCRQWQREPAAAGRHPLHQQAGAAPCLIPHREQGRTAGETSHLLSIPIPNWFWRMQPDWKKNRSCTTFTDYDWIMWASICRFVGSSRFAAGLHDLVYYCCLSVSLYSFFYKVG